MNWHIKKDESFPYWFVMYLTLEMLNIIDYLHKCKIIHAKIKPDNLLIDKLPDSYTLTNMYLKPLLGAGHVNE